MIDNNYHFEGKDKTGKPIIIDAAFVDGKYEVMAMNARTHMDFACERVDTLEQAEKEYAAMVDRYALSEGENPPLTGKYAKLRDDYAEARKIGEQAAHGEDDGGTCNFDSTALHLPRWNEKLVEQAAKEAGGNCFALKSYGGKRFVFSTPNVGQANRNTKAAEAMTKFLELRGYSATTYYQMD